MTENQKFAAAVDRGEFPPIASVPLGPEDAFKDERGEIINVLLTPITSVARIFSKRGTVRANHLHQTDWHYALVERGKVLYFERPEGSTDVPDPVSYGEGKMFFTRPGVEHAMLFADDTVIYTFAKNVRTKENHEADLKRVEFITPATAARFVPPLHPTSGK